MKFSASPRTVLTVNKKPLKVKGETVLLKSVEQHATLRTFLDFWFSTEIFRHHTSLGFHKDCTPTVLSTLHLDYLHSARPWYTYLLPVGTLSDSSPC